MTEPEVKPLHETFESAGLEGVVSRLGTKVAERYPDLQHLNNPMATAFGEFQFLVTSCDDALRPHGARTAAALVDALLAATARVAARPAPLTTTAVTSPRRAAATIRLHFGIFLEAVAASCASDLCDPADLFAMQHKHELSQLFFDSALMATWTSVHAEFLMCVDELQEITTEDVMVPNPELHLATSAFSMCDLVALYDRASVHKSVPKSAQATLSLLTRLTNPGSRGWDSALRNALSDEAATRICLHAVTTGLTGLHPTIHPAVRLPWQSRAALSFLAKSLGTPFLKDLSTRVPGCVKDVMRVHLSAMLSSDFATLHALATCRQAAGQLGAPPRVPPLPSVQSAMHAFVCAGSKTLEDRSTSLANTMTAMLAPPTAKKKNGQKRKVFEDAGDESVLLQCRVAVSTAVTAAPTAVAVTASLLSSTFRSAFLPLWFHGQSHSHRVARLDNTQYKALHIDNPAHKLCSLLHTDDRLRVQRIAFALPNASLLSVDRVFSLLGMWPVEDDNPPAPNPAVSRAQREAEAKVLKLSATDAAKFIEFSRAASLRAQLLTFDLGERTRRMQASALCERLLLKLEPDEVPETAIKRAPTHATELFVCTECRRVVNACQDGTLKKQVPFNELGLSASMLHIDGPLECGHLRCSKRSSAALRTALSLEELAERKCIEELEIEQQLPLNLQQSSISAWLPNSDVSKLRRDTKNCLEQRDRALSCGSLPLVKVELFGRAVRVYSNFYALCSLCGSLIKLNPTLRFSSEPCCLRCDFAMLKGKAALEREIEAIPKPPTPSCRFCGKTQSLVSASKWKIIHAPLDNSGLNLCIPPPLRTVSYCPLHSRSWLASAHKILPMNVILSHILTRARPMIGASGKETKEKTTVSAKPKIKAVSSRITKRIAKNKRRKLLDRV